MSKIYILSAFSSFLEHADRCFLPCPFKYLTGYDCPGCGFQRAFLALLKGDITKSFHLYPPVIPILLTILICLPANYWWGAKSKPLIRTLFIITGTIIMLSYFYKIFVPHASK